MTAKPISELRAKLDSAMLAESEHLYALLEDMIDESDHIQADNEDSGQDMSQS